MAVSGRQVHPIEQESYRILRTMLDLEDLPWFSRAVVERVVHATADVGYATDLVVDEAQLAAGAAALHAGAPLVADVAMVAAGITARRASTFIAAPETVDLAERTGSTRSAAAIRVAAERVGPGAVWVIGCAPTALTQLLQVGADPAFVVGLPVGFVGAVEAKAALRVSGLAAVTNRSVKGGSAAAAAAVHALMHARPLP
ncbi:MAG: precorrin-8X methylmutase [Actinobacteria bacterium]|nr:precorrin-8X methylmutase [Actinomycetota bacterium]